MIGGRRPHLRYPCSRRSKRGRPTGECLARRIRADKGPQLFRTIGLRAAFRRSARGHDRPEHCRLAIAGSLGSPSTRNGIQHRGTGRAPNSRLYFGPSHTKGRPVRSADRSSPDFSQSIADRHPQTCMDVLRFRRLRNRPKTCAFDLDQSKSARDARVCLACGGLRSPVQHVGEQSGNSTSRRLLP